MRTRFTPKVGKIYQNAAGGEYKCIKILEEGKAIMRNTKSGWTLNANGCGIYSDETIDWDYSTNGYFA